MSARRSAAFGVWLGLAGTVLLGACASTGGAGGRNPEAAGYNVQLGLGYLQQGNLAVAKEKLDRAAVQDPDNAQVHAAMALLDERLGKDKEADREYRSALALSPHDPAMLNNYAVYLCAHGRAADGERYFEQAASNPLYATPWAAYTNAGVCLRGVHRDEEAAQRFSRALQVNPTYAEAVYQASDLDFSAQRNAQARLRVDLFLLNNPATPDLLLLAWRIASVQQDADGADRYAARLRREFPNSEQARALGGKLANPG